MKILMRIWLAIMYLCFGVAVMGLSYSLFTETDLHEQDTGAVLSFMFYVEGFMAFGMATAALFLAIRVGLGKETL